MRALLFLAFLVLSSSMAWAKKSASSKSELDIKLAAYIAEFEMTPMQAPAPRREALYQLGQRLFSDPQLSGKNNISCLDCHTPRYGSGDALPLGIGEGARGHGVNRRQLAGDVLLRNSPPLFNLGVEGVSHLFWDGRVSQDEAGHWHTPEPGLNGAAPTLATIAHTLDSLLAVQALFPIADPVEMLGRGSLLSREEAWKNVLTRLFAGSTAEIYTRLFQAAFGPGPYNIGHVGNALAEFQRHAFASLDTPWDRYLKGELNILSDEMKRGALIFLEKGQCANCHKGMHLSAFDFDAVGTPQLGVGDRDDTGRMAFTGDEEDRYMFRVSPLRNIAITAPYMHNGVFKDLWEVIEFYDRPEETLMNFVWRSVLTNYDTALTIENDPVNLLARAAAMAEDLPRDIQFTETEEAQLWCFLTVALTDLRFQARLQGVENENANCSPVLPRLRGLRR